MATSGLTEKDAYPYTTLIWTKLSLPPCIAELRIYQILFDRNEFEYRDLACVNVCHRRKSLQRQDARGRMTGMDPNPKPRRRRLRYSLRTLLLLVTVASAGFAVVGYKIRQAQRQRVAVEAIEKLGGFLMYDYEVDEAGNMLMPQERRQPGGPEWLRNWLGGEFFDKVRVVGLGIGENQYIPQPKTLQESDLVHLGSLPDLQCLNLDGMPISGVGLVHLSGSPRFESLTLRISAVTDAGLSHLQDLHALRELDLGYTKITDVALVHLRGLNKLERLSLDTTKITDAGLMHLYDLKNLRHLVLGDTAVTEDGCRELQRRLPNLEITWWPQQISEPE